MANEGQMGETIDRAIDLYDAIQVYMDKQQRPPTMRDIAELMGLPRTNVGMARHYLGILQGWGWVDYTPRSSRSIRLTRVTERIVIRKKSKKVKRDVA